MNLQEQLRRERGSMTTYNRYSDPAEPFLSFTPERRSDIQDRRISLLHHTERKTPTFKVQEPIPEDDLLILTKIYNKEYEDCGRKRGALLRYIKHYRKTVEPENHSRRLIKHIEKVVRKTLS